jgi:hypothetical protein
LNPLPDATNEVLYYYDYSDDGETIGTHINDRSARNNDADSNHGTLTLQYGSSTGLDFLLPGARPWDVNTSGTGAVTVGENLLGHQDISDYGGYTFETYLKRTGAPNTIQNIWNPEGMHSLEILPAVPILGKPATLQFAIRGLNFFTVPVNDVLPLNEWHHIMAVMRVIEPLPNGGDPTMDPLMVEYELLIDGETVDAGILDGTELPINPLPPGGQANLNDQAAFATLETSPNPLHGIGWQEFGDPVDENGIPTTTRRFFGEMAMTRLSLGALTPQQSLYDFGTIENADFDGNGMVDGRDFLIWQRGFGSGTTLAEGDANGDGSVNGTDLGIWKSQYGVGGLASSLSVPEPTTLFLAISVLLMPFRRRQ